MNQQTDNRKSAIVKIHVAKRQLGLDDETYRAMLLDVTKKGSCKDMSIGELYQVLKRLEYCGFKVKKPAKRRGKYSPKSTGQPVDVIRAMWIQMAEKGIVQDSSESALLAWVKRTTSQLNGGIGVDSMEWLSRDEEMTGKVINALRGWNKRVMTKWRREDFKTLRDLHEASPGRNVAGLAKELLKAGKIFYWPEFGLEFNIEDSPQYTGANRGK